MGYKRQCFDVAVLTILAVEFDAVVSALEIDENSSEYLCDDITYRTALIRKKAQQDIRVAVFCAAYPGNTYIAALTTLVAKKLEPSLIILVGIAAGIRPDNGYEGTKIGCVFMPKEIFDFTMSVNKSSEATEPGKSDHHGTTRHRIKTYDVPASVLSQFKEPNKAKVLNLRNKILGTENYEIENLGEIPGKKKHQSYAFHEQYVSLEAEFSDNMLASSNALLKDPVVLQKLQETRGEIRIGDMESAGVAVGCNLTNTKWMVLRGVSDFGDKDKTDQFHRFASANVAAYLRIFLDEILDVGLLRKSPKLSIDPVNETANSISQILMTFAKIVHAVFNKPINIQIYWPAKQIKPDGTEDFGVRRHPGFRAERGLHSESNPTIFYSFDLRSTILVAKAGYEINDCYKSFGPDEHPMLRWVYALPLHKSIENKKKLQAVICCSGEENFLCVDDNGTIPELQKFKLIIKSLGDVIWPIFQQTSILEKLGSFRVMAADDN